MHIIYLVLLLGESNLCKIKINDAEIRNLQIVPIIVILWKIRPNIEIFGESFVVK